MRNVGLVVVLSLASVQATILTASAQEAAKPHPVTQIERYYDALAIELDKRKLRRPHQPLQPRHWNPVRASLPRRV